MSDSARRVVHIGIDGGSYGVLDAIADRGIMPAYRRFREAGGTATLRSTTPWFTVPAWITWMTGVSAERHGYIYWTNTSASDHWAREGADRFVSALDIPYPTIFRIASEAGLRVASVNMPVTFPPATLNGVMVSGFLGPTDPTRVAHPPGFLRRYPDYEVDLEGGPETGSPKLRSDREVAQYASRLSSMAEVRLRVLSDLLEEGFDLTSMVFVGTDRLSHVAWPQIEAVLERDPLSPGEEAVLQYYRTLDRVLEMSSRRAPDALIVISSDHGQGPPPPRLIAPNVLLREWGQLTLRTHARRAARLVPWSGLRRRIFTVWRRFRNLPKGSAPFVDWTKSPAFAVAMPHCRLFGIALRDGDPGADLPKRLMDLVDPDTGERPIADVLNRADLCDGHGMDTYPALLVQTSPGYGVTTGVEGPVFRTTPPGPSGYHEPDGILLASGPGVSAGRQREVSIADVAPTLAAYLGIEPPEHMDGTRIPWIAPKDSPPLAVKINDDPAAGPSLTKEEEAAIAQHLRDLGYVD